ncbi:hypothetical protein WA026_016129 [Henosepilachna vigintioctopunctata]|uniref:Uncharacterized protein n=1 Tax=Henosepilachna vigintioctopunctata TaxID=420089 RepID=A0AAW1TY68_9CUCU
MSSSDWSSVTLQIFRFCSFGPTSDISKYIAKCRILKQWDVGIGNLFDVIVCGPWHTLHGPTLGGDSDTYANLIRKRHIAGIKTGVKKEQTTGERVDDDKGHNRPYAMHISGKPRSVFRPGWSFEVFVKLCRG